MGKVTIEDIRKYVKENSECDLLSEEYLNNNTNILFKCRCGREFKRTYSNFKRYTKNNVKIVVG